MMLPGKMIQRKLGTVLAVTLVCLWLFSSIYHPLNPLLGLYETQNESEVPNFKNELEDILNNQTAFQGLIRSVNQSKISPDDFSLNMTDVVNPHPFKYIINQRNTCKNKDIFLLVYIHTDPGHIKRRMAIRQTWGNEKGYDVNIRIMFFMGKTTLPKVQSSISYESELFGDIVQEDFIDSYRNLTYKAVAGLKWITLNCKHAKFILKSDDDMFINMFSLLNHLKSRVTTDSDSELLLCYLWPRMKPKTTGKWKVSESEYNNTHYPAYCSGSAFLMSTDVAIELHKTSYYVPFFWVDDLYITGLLMMKTNFKHVQFKSTYVLMKTKYWASYFTGARWYTYLFSHVHDLHDVRTTWENVKELNRQMEASDYSSINLSQSVLPSQKINDIVEVALGESNSTSLRTT